MSKGPVCRDRCHGRVRGLSEAARAWLGAGGGLPGRTAAQAGGLGGVSMKTSLREAVGYACVHVCAQHDGSPFVAHPWKPCEAVGK